MAELGTVFTALFSGLWAILKTVPIPYLNCTADVLVLGIFVINVSIVMFNLIIDKDKEK